MRFTPPEMGARTRKTWVYHPSGGGRINHPSRERPVEPDASRGARPVRGRLLAVNLFGRRVQSPVSIPCVCSIDSRGAWATGTDLRASRKCCAEAEVIEAGEREAVRANPPTGCGPKLRGAIGVSSPRHGSVQRAPASGVPVWRHTGPGCETRPGDPHEKCGRRIAQRRNARKR